LWLVWIVFTRYGFDAVTTMAATKEVDFSSGIAIVVGTAVTGALLQPDVCRFARSPRVAGMGSFLTFALGTPFILVLAGLPGLASGERDLVPVMMALGVGVSALLILLFSAWTMNTYNLYASSLIFATIFTRSPRWLLALGAGCIGTTLGLMGVSEQLVPYMVALSVVVPPVASVYLCDFYFGDLARTAVDPPRWRPRQLLACALGIGLTGAGMHFSVSLTTVAPIDSMIITLASYFALRARSSHVAGAATNAQAQ
jgi:cytosine permease